MKTPLFPREISGRLFVLLGMPSRPVHAAAQLAAIVISTFSLATIATAQTTWINENGGGWFDDANWDNGVPGTSSQDAVINSLSSSFSVLIGGDPVDIDTLQMNAPGSELRLFSSFFANDTELNGGTFVLDRGSLDGGVYNQAGGSIQFASGSPEGANVNDFFTDTTIVGDLDLGATNVVLQMWDSSSFTGDATIGNNSVLTHFSNVALGDQTINLVGVNAEFNASNEFAATRTVGGEGTVFNLDGAGSIISGVELFNNGRVTANGPGMRFLTTFEVDNQGTIESIGGATLDISSQILGFSGGTLGGGTWRVSEGDSGEGSLPSTINLTEHVVSSNNAEIILSGAGSFFNSGTQDAALESTLESNSGTLRLLNRSFISGNDSGLLTNSGTIQLQDSAFSGGQIENLSSGEIFGSGEITEPVLNEGVIRAVGGNLRTGDVGGTSGTVIVEGDGVFETSGTVASQIDAVGGVIAGQGSQFQGDVTFRGATASGEIDIQKTLSVEDGGTFGASTLLSDSTMSVVGQTTISAGGELHVEAGALFSGDSGIVVEAGGTLRTDGVVDKDVVVEQDGLLEGIGELIGIMTVEGLLEPGNSAGTLDIDGEVELTDSAMVCIEVGGTMAGTEHDQLRGTRAGLRSVLNLDGELMITLIDGFVPTNVDTFVIAENFEIRGKFANTSRVSLAGGGSFDVEYTPTSIILSDFIAIPEPSFVCFGMAGLVGLGLRRRRNR